MKKMKKDVPPFFIFLRLVELQAGEEAAEVSAEALPALWLFIFMIIALI
jgi:hypothetical protein